MAEAIYVTKQATPEQLKRLARYEDSPADFIGLSANDFERSNFEGIMGFYLVTLEDIKEACKNLKEKEVSTFHLTDWLNLMIVVMAENFGIDDETIHQIKVRVPETDEDLKACLFNLLEGLEMQTSDTGVPDYKLSDEVIEEYEYRKKFPDDLGHLTQWQMDDFLNGYAVPGEQIRVPKADIPLFLKVVDEGCKRNMDLALFLKGYGCYGGDDIFPCDWKASEACLLRLYENTQDPQYANKLGFLYYYGRVNDRIPQYDKAFQFFTIGAINRVYESCYMIADMFWDGNGTVRSPKSADCVIEWSYPASLYQFCNGKQDSNFAEIAYRMARIRQRRANYAINAKDLYLEEAYRFYLEADYAITDRMKSFVKFGDQSTKEDIEQGLAEVKSQLPRDFYKDNLQDDYLYFTIDFMKSYNVMVSLRRASIDSVKMTLRVVPKKNHPRPKQKLLTIPQFGYCGVTDTLVVYLERVEFLNCKYGDGEEFKVDNFVEESDGTWELYRKNQLLCEFQAGNYVIKKSDYVK